MAARGGQVGNKNAAKGKRWAAAIEAAVQRRVSDGRLKGLEDLADKLIDAVLDGDMTAVKEFGDRYDGKPAQMITGPGDDGEHKVTGKIEMVIVDAAASPKKT